MVVYGFLALVAISVSLAIADPSADSTSAVSVSVSASAPASSGTGLVQYYEVPDGAVGLCDVTLSDNENWVKIDSSSFEKSECGKVITINLDDGSSVEGLIEDGCGDQICRDGYLYVSKAVMTKLGYSGDAISSAKPSASWSY